MVVAEIPLWLVHSGETGGANGMLGNLGGDAFAGRSESKDGQAQTSLSLLQNSGRGKKCAIYSVDINAAGTRIATCGGDGTVRLWTVSSLFSRKRSRFGQDGNYESGEASGESSPSDNDEKDFEKGDHKNASNNGNGIEGDSEIAARENAVHDLSSFVRRKKGGETVQSPPRPLAAQRIQDISPKNQSPLSRRVPQQNQKEHHQRLLCTLSAHTGSSVLAVRFSHGGRFLASAGDDGAVCIYTKDAGGSAIGNLTDHSAEPWSRLKLCRGHALDAVGLAWAPDDSHLVSCSLDSESPIIVWKLTDLARAAEGRQHFTHSNILCNPYKVLGKGVHTSTVKGVTFDPAGTYLASSGDDPAVCIWRAHDDWGLERRIDASSGIFRRWKEDNSQSLSTQTLFRRLSWSTDGSFICSTNCMIKNKHVASTISRDGWNVSTARTVAAGAANLVGHKQPVVVSRHCSRLLASKRKSDDGDISSSDSEGAPDYATLLALGDRHGFVTVWSTKKSRPIFKLQCSESRCTVTDLAWGQINNEAMILLVSLLDGQCVALRFQIPDELGALLSDKDQAMLFNVRYGIDIDDSEYFNRRSMFIGDSSGPKFIENALQMSLEHQLDIKADSSEKGSDVDTTDPQPFDDSTDHMLTSTNAASVRSQQEESQSKGKKRIRPVLMSGDDNPRKQKPLNSSSNEARDNKSKHSKKETDPLKHASDLAEMAASFLNSIPQLKDDALTDNAAQGEDSTRPAQPASQGQRLYESPQCNVPAGSPLEYNTTRLQTVDLPVARRDQEERENPVASCTNSFCVPLGAKGPSYPCIDLTISTAGSVSWKDQIVGTSCSALAAAHKFLALGTADGAIQLYGTSPSLGWACRTAFRSHPLLVLGHPIVTLQLHEAAKETPNEELDMLVVTADGTFGIYQIFPELRIRNKGSVMPAMTHTALGIGHHPIESRQVKLSRILLTDTKQLLLLLSLTEAAGLSTSADSTTASRNVQRQPTGSSAGCPYGSIQAFIYNLALELWMRISDGRFVVSDFYSTLPSAKLPHFDDLTLSRLDDAVRFGALDSSLTPSLHDRPKVTDPQAGYIYQHIEEKTIPLATRSHCEDRMACALAVGSLSEFKHWLTLYVRTLTLGGHADHLRVLVDMLLGVGEKSTENGNHMAVPSHANGDVCWWLSSTPQLFKIDRKFLIRNIVIAEMSKNRALQRLTNEISIELDSLPT